MAAAAARERGNALFRAGQYKEAAAEYSSALDALGSTADDKETRVALLKNRSACRLKLKELDGALADAMAAVELAPSDAKAYYRQASALEELGQLDEAYKILRRILAMDPSNADATAAMQRVMKRRADEVAALQEQAKPSSHVDQLVSQVANLTALASAKAAAEKIHSAATDGAFATKMATGRHFRTLLKTLAAAPLDKPEGEKLAVALLHAMTIMATDPMVGEALAVELTDDMVAQLTKAPTPKMHAAFLTMMAGLAFHAGRPEEGEDKHRIHKYPDVDHNDRPIRRVPPDQRSSMALFARVPQQAINVFMPAMRSSHDEVQSAAIQGLMKVVGSKAAATTFISGAAFPALLSVCRTRGSKLQSLLSAALARILEAVGSQDRVVERCREVITPQLERDNDADRIAGLVALAAVTQADPEVGAGVLLQPGVLEELLDSWDIDAVETRVALLEALAQACASKGARSAIGLQGAEILTRAMRSSDLRCARLNQAKKWAAMGFLAADALPPDHDCVPANDARIMVRAAVTLAKCVFNETGDRAEFLKEKDVTDKLFSLVVDTQQPADVRLWAAEGVAYLSIFGDYKDRIALDGKLLDAIFSLIKTEDSALQYGVVQTLANLTTYRRRLSEEQQQLKKLQELAGEKKVKEHPADDDDRVAKRATEVLKRGAVTALVALVKEKANRRQNLAEAIAQVMLNLATDPHNRGLMVQQGAAKVLLPLANEGTKAGMDAAAQALAKLAITIDPALAFKGEKSAELVRPLVRLLQSEDGLQNFEALLALTNLTSNSEELQERLLHEHGLTHIESLMFSENDMIKRAATEALCNMTMHPDVQAKYDAATTPDRVRVLLAMADVDDFATRRAASGALAILTSSSEKVCRDIYGEKFGLPILVTLLNDAAQAALPPEEKAKAKARAAEEARKAAAAEGATTEAADEAAQAVLDKPDLTPDEGRQLQHRAISVLRNLANVPELARGMVQAGLLPAVEMLQFAEFSPVAELAKEAYAAMQAAAKEGS